MKCCTCLISLGVLRVVDTNETNGSFQVRIKVFLSFTHGK